MKTASVKFDRTRAMTAAIAAADCVNAGLTVSRLDSVANEIQRQLIGVTGKAWQKYGQKMINWIEDYKAAIISGDELTGNAFSVFMKKGNSKLPFVTFGTLPVVLCPGAGECASFCYSLKSWRYPAAFFGMMQNSLMLGHAIGRRYIARQFLQLKKNVDFRLYVDGDFSSQDDVEFWAWLLAKRPDVKAYGYSKSFVQLITAHDAGHVMPENYRLNLSSGHNAGPDMVERIKSLPCYRGQFIAVAAPKSATNGQLIAAHKVATGRKAFACPGLCGECTSVGHACGSDAFAGMDIIIKVH